jgi:hypothetical protein
MSLSNGLLCYYSFDSNSSIPVQNGTTILNLANYQYDLSYSGTAGIVSVSGTQTKYGDGSLYNSLYSVGNYYKCSSYTSSVDLNNGFTFACWVYFQSGLSGYFFLIGDSTSNIGLAVSGPSIIIASYGTAAGINVQYNQPGSYGWHHILITATYSYGFSRTTITTYVNGSPTTSIFGGGGNPFGGSGGSAPTNSTLTYNSQILTGDKSMYLLGYQSTVASLSTYLDEVMLFSRVLSGTEITAVYNRSYTSYLPAVYIPPPCFKEGSKILAFIKGREQYVPVETLKRGDLIKTSKSGYKAIRVIGKKTIDNHPDSDKKNRLYRYTCGTCPELFEDLCITGEHCALVNVLSDEKLEEIKEHMGGIYITEGDYRVPACLDERAHPCTKSGPATIWHFALEHPDDKQNYGVFANGLLVESSSIRYMSELSNMELV